MGEVVCRHVLPPVAPTYPPLDKTVSVLIVGDPGSGKRTFIRQLVDNSRGAATKTLGDSNHIIRCHASPIEDCSSCREKLWFHVHREQRTVEALEGAPKYSHVDCGVVVIDTTSRKSLQRAGAWIDRFPVLTPVAMVGMKYDVEMPLRRMPGKKNRQRRKHISSSDVNFKYLEKVGILLNSGNYSMYVHDRFSIFAVLR